jgi:hypothetical protein
LNYRFTIINIYDLIPTPVEEVAMVLSLELAAILLIGFAVWAARQPDDTGTLQTASLVMAWIATMAAVLIPLAVLATFLFPAQTGALNLRLYHLGGAGVLTSGVPLTMRLVAFACATVPLGIVVWGLFSLRWLLLLYAQGQVFTTSAVGALTGITAAPFWYGIASFIAEAPITLALSWENGAGHRIVSLSIGLDDLVLLFLSGVATVIVRAMAEGRRIADENAQIV